MMTRWQAGRWGGWALAALLGVLIGLVLFAPASLADRVLDRASGGRARLADTEGTIWRGSGRLVLVDVGAETTRRRSLAGVALQGRVEWRMSRLPLLLGQVDATLQIDGMADPVRIQGNYGELRIGAGAVGLPALELGRLGSPWNTLRPTGTLRLRWDNLSVRQGTLEGRAQIELRDASSAMTPVRPLGSYRVDVVGQGGQTELTIHTLSGPLRLQGSGTFSARTGLRFVAEASADAPERARLDSFLGLIGRRDGGRTVIRIGA